MKNFRNPRGFAGYFTKVLCLILSIGMVLIGFPIAAPVQAQTSANCAKEIDNIERETQAFDRDVRDQNLDFVKSDVKDAALSDIRRRLAGNPTSEALFDLKDKKEKFDSWAEIVKNSGTTLEDLKTCIATKGCPLQEFAKRQNKALAIWIQSLGDEGINTATERVNNAASLIQGYASRTLSMAEGSALRAVENCTEQFEQHAQANTQAKMEIQVTPPPPPPPSSGQPSGAETPPAKGPSAGAKAAAVVGGLALGGAIILGVESATKKEDSSSCPSGYASCGNGLCCPWGKYYVPCTKMCQTCPQADNSCVGSPCPGAVVCVK